MYQFQDKIEQAHALLTEALALLDERDLLVEAAFVQSALDRMTETIVTLSSEDEVVRLPCR